MHLGALAGMYFQKIHLVQLYANLHLGWVYHLEKRHARPNLIALLHRSHSAAEPDGVVDDHSFHGRVNDHSCGVSLRVTHGLQRAVALNFLNSNG